MRARAAFAAVLLLCAGPAQAQLSPLQKEARVVKSVSDPARSLVVSEAMVFLDSPVLTTHGIRLTPGIYVFEAEDDDNLYYRAPDKVEYRIFRSGAAVDGRFIAGGVYFSKASISLVPAGVYMSVDETHKTLTWKLGAEFVRLEGHQWSRTGAK